jgi:hypothetical protein
MTREAEIKFLHESQIEDAARVMDASVLTNRESHVSIP